MNMFAPSSRVLRIWVCVLVGMSVCGWSRGAVTGGTGASAPAETAGLPAAQSPSGLTAMLPLPTNSPVRLFRHLLTLSSAEQEVELATRSESSRAVLRRKLQDYQAMPESEREARLRALEFHHYLQFLLTAPASLREPWLASMPAEYRPLCEERLRLWVAMPKELQSYMLDRRDTLQWIMRWEEATEAQRLELFRALPPDRQAAIEKDVARWQGMSVVERERAWKATRQMFGLPEKEQRRILASIPETNRLPSAKVVQSLNQMPSPDRERYLESWRKFSQLNPSQRARFMQGWDRWSKMSEAEREVWRKVARQAPPVVPPLPLVPPPIPRPKTEARVQPVDTGT